ncbi:hypothetical protein D3C72_1937180 [compost metagenome]
MGGRGATWLDLSPSERGEAGFQTLGRQGSDAAPRLILRVVSIPLQRIQGDTSGAGPAYRERPQPFGAGDAGAVWLDVDQHRV